MILEVRHLRMIEAIVKGGGVTNAARRLHLTQPAVSHALRELERRLGTRLFQRNARGMIPTDKGERLLETAEVVLRELQRAERDLLADRADRVGVLRIATQCYTCFHWLPGVLNAFSRDLPEIDVQIVPEATRRPLAALQAGELDLAIVNLEPAEPGVVAEPLFDDQMVAVMAPWHRLAGRSHLDAEDFADEHLVLHFDAERCYPFTQLLNPAGVRPRRISELQLTEAVVEAVKAGIGLSVLARWTVEPFLKAGNLRAVRLTPGGLQRTWYAAYREEAAGSRGLKELIEVFRCCALPAASERT